MMPAPVWGRDPFAINDFLDGDLFRFGGFEAADGRGDWAFR